MQPTALHLPQIRNITLYISRLKFRPLTWRNSHPYVLVDRFEDVTPPEKLQAAPQVGRVAAYTMVDADDRGLGAGFSVQNKGKCVRAGSGDG